MRHILLVFVFVLTTSHMAFAEAPIINPSNPDVASLNVTQSVDELVNVYGKNDSRILIKRVIICEIRVKLSPELPLKLYSMIVENKKRDCPLVPPPRRVREHNPNPERPA